MLNIMNISVVIPCHNEENNITEITNRIFAILNKINLDLHRIIFIDDGSTDNSWSEIISLKEKHNNKILGIKFSRNFGHQNAVMAGLKFCKSDLTLIIDADLQDPPEVIKEMYSEIIQSKATKSNASFVAASASGSPPESRSSRKSVAAV